MTMSCHTDGAEPHTVNCTHFAPKNASLSYAELLRDNHDLLHSREQCDETAKVVFVVKKVRQEECFSNSLPARPSCEIVLPRYKN